MKFRQIGFATLLIVSVTATQVWADHKEDIIFKVPVKLLGDKDNIASVGFWVNCAISQRVNSSGSVPVGISARSVIAAPGEKFTTNHADGAHHIEVGVRFTDLFQLESDTAQDIRWECTVRKGQPGGGGIIKTRFANWNSVGTLKAIHPADKGSCIAAQGTISVPELLPSLEIVKLCTE